MNPIGILLFFTILVIFALAGLVVIGIGVKRLIHEQVSHTEVGVNTRIRCCGIDLLISLFGIGLTFIGIFSFYRAVS